MENKKTQLYEISIRALYCAFVVLTLIFFCLPAVRYFGESVYRCAAHGNYLDGLDGRWETTYFVLELFANVFSDVDLIDTPCALMVMISCFSALYALAFFIVRVIAKGKFKRVNLKADAVLLAIYLIYIILSVIMIFGVMRWFSAELIGPAPIVLIIFSALFFIASVFIFIKRKKYFVDEKST